MPLGGLPDIGGVRRRRRPPAPPPPVHAAPGSSSPGSLRGSYARGQGEAQQPGTPGYANTRAIQAGHTPVLNYGPGAAQPSPAPYLSRLLGSTQNAGNVPEIVPPQYRAAVAKYGPLLNDALKAQGSPLTGEEYLAKTIQFESGWDPHNVNPDSGAAGLGQFMAGTADTFRKQYGVETRDPNNPEGMIQGAAMHLSGKFGHPPLYAGYNPGYSSSDPIPPVNVGRDVPVSRRSAKAQKQLAALGLGGAQGAPQGQPAQLGSGVGKGPYLNPYGSPTEIDRGVDYGASGAIGAIGKARVVDATTGSPYWSGFGGGNVGYQLLKGPRKGWTVYVAEHVTPTVKPGQVVKKGQQVATGGGGIETGWAAKPGVPYVPGGRPLADALGDPKIGTRHDPHAGGDATPDPGTDPAAGRDFLKFLQGKPSPAGLTSPMGPAAAGGGGSLGALAGAIGGGSIAGGVPGGSQPNPVQIQTAQLASPITAQATFPAGYQAPQAGGVTSQPSIADLFSMLTGAPATPAVPGAPAVPGVPSVPGVRSRRRPRYALSQ